MLTAKEAKELAGIDSRTTKEQFEDDVSHYIKIEAESGHRRMRYRIPEKFFHPNLIAEIEIKLEELGFDVYYDRPNLMLEVRW